MKQKSVCLLINTLDSGGAEKVCTTIGNELANKGYKVDLWVRKSEETTLSKILDKRINVSYMNRDRVRKSIIPLIKLIKSRKPEIILVFDIEFLIFIHLLRSILNFNFKIVARSINTLSIAYKDQKGFWKKLIWIPLAKYFLNRTDTIIAQSSGMKNDLINYFNIPQSKIKLIHNPAINLDLNDNSKQLINKDRLEFVFIGRLFPPKGIFYLIEAFNIALKIEPKIHLTIVGEGPEKTKLIEEVKRLKIEDSISFAGFQSNPKLYYQKSIATVLTSIYEGFPNVLVESIAEGTPVISFNCPSGPIDIIEPEVNGILVEYLNIQRFADAIIDIATAKIKFDYFKVKESAKKFDLDQIVKQYEDILFFQK
ncbi:MAG: glycosyltransferase [Prolixibacteraceae bacterium]|nr:glycosyltransferase [Prolixibacteraceae bacterium]